MGRDWRLAVRGVVLYRGLQQSCVFIYIRFRPLRAFTPQSCCDISYFVKYFKAHFSCCLGSSSRLFSQHNRILGSHSQCANISLVGRKLRLHGSLMSECLKNRNARTVLST